MNRHTVSAECLHGCCTACDCENACACSCHLEDLYDPWEDEGWEAADDPYFESTC